MQWKSSWHDQLYNGDNNDGMKSSKFRVKYEFMRQYELDYVSVCSFTSVCNFKEKTNFKAISMN